MQLIFIVKFPKRELLRACLAERQETLPNQIKQEIEGLTPLRQKILRLFGKSVADIYQLSYEQPCSM